jgi:hypothetical protein
MVAGLPMLDGMTMDEITESTFAMDIVSTSVQLKATVNSRRSKETEAWASKVFTNVIAIAPTVKTEEKEDLSGSEGEAHVVRERPATSEPEGRTLLPSATTAAGSKKTAASNAVIQRLHDHGWDENLNTAMDVRTYISID